MIKDFEGKRPSFGDYVYVDEQALVVGDVSMADHVSVWPMAVVRGDVNSIRIGPRSNIQDNSVLHVTHDGPYSPGGVALDVGADVTIGHRVILHACSIGDRCLIGMGAIVMDEAVLEDEIMLAAGSLVPPGKHLEGGYLYVGSPVERVRPITDEERAMLKYSAGHYVRLKKRHMENLSRVPT